METDERMRRKILGGMRHGMMEVAGKRGGGDESYWKRRGRGGCMLKGTEVDGMVLRGMQKR